MMIHEVSLVQRQPVAWHLLDRLGILFCRLMHQKITRPFRGEYVCLECLRKHQVDY